MKTPMQITRNIIGISLLILTMNSFIGYNNGQDNPPGTIECIGDAGSPNVFVFRKWAFTKMELPNDNLENIQAEIDINVTSAETKWKDLEKSVKKKKDYFYVKKFPTATINIKGAKKQADGSYTTDATLSLKGITKTVALTFTASDSKPYHIKGSGTLNRRDFKFTGDGPKDEVPVHFDFVLPVE